MDPLESRPKLLRQHMTSVTKENNFVRRYNVLPCMHTVQHLFTVVLAFSCTEAVEFERTPVHVMC